jgi:hypothetical protein
MSLNNDGQPTNALRPHHGFLIGALIIVALILVAHASGIFNRNVAVTPNQTGTLPVVTPVVPTPTPNPQPAPAPVPAPVTRGIIYGTVLLGPTCPVQRNPPDPACADRPFAVNLVLTNADGSRVIKEFSSNADGNFNLSVPAGTYAIRQAASTSMLPRCANVGPILVTAGGRVAANVSCDTGIR